MSTSIVSMNNSNLSNCHADELTRLVKEVVGTWSWKVIDEDRIALLIPSEQHHRGVSKSRFVNLLEFCEDVLKVKEVVALFDRANLSVAAGFPRTLRYVGFRALAPEDLPESMDPANHFAMTYVI